MRNTNVEISFVSGLSDQELEETAWVSSVAYRNASSPAVDLLTGGKLELLPDLFRSMTQACLIDGECYIAKEVAMGRIVGSALWFPPGKHLWATDEIREVTGLNTFLNKLDSAAKDWWVNDYQVQLSGFLKENYGPETELESWWLNSVSVLPEYQRNEIATLLLDQVLKKAATNEAIGLCTDTEANFKFYKSLRFKEIGVLYMRHPADGSNVKIWGFKQHGSRT